jgi:hypothetical protein
VKKLWKTLKAAVPGPLVVLVGQWLKLFVNTDLVYPGWAKDAQDTSLALGVVAVAVVSLVVSEWPKFWLKVVTTLLLVGAGVLVYYYWVVIGDRLAPSGLPELEVLHQHRLWYNSFVASMILFMAGIATGVLSQPDPPEGWWKQLSWWQKLIWVVAGGLVLIGLILAVRGLIG